MPIQISYIGQEKLYNMNPPQLIFSFVALTIFQLCIRHRGCVIGNYHGAKFDDDQL
jgi:hypothetical protein